MSSKYLIFNDKENTGQTSPASHSSKRPRRPLRELSGTASSTRETFYEFTSAVAPTGKKPVITRPSSTVLKSGKQDGPRQMTLRSMR
ncbi:protein of unknown function [Taphrina deformans PYCC 5710]|uniref:Uncharacterized protein n=1 Tax=Taphrina deformans (strain PYCC 5710 / ATCC 11124 / CBS 356.35 / IMI 108563 / JCM 9778 / NBRC 8474) TaxID=1097556 RepID=R4XEC2_TAPDE|nr:protein of unknown function [Taphrina deformans PYCC 5710]|eukprot:CCG84172.1 protein of unknown function [Taphrina deformans PYCC 5710]